MIRKLNVREILQKARKLISDPAKWTKGAYARDAKRQWIDTKNTKAVCWCAAGALRHVTPFDHDYGAFDALCQECPGRSIIEFNDSHTHAEVLEVFDRAIAKCG